MSANRRFKYSAPANAIHVQRQIIKASTFDALPDNAFVRQSDLVKNLKRPELPVPLPFSASTLWRMVKAKTFPQPIKLSSRLTCWLVSEVRSWMAAQTAN